MSNIDSSREEAIAAGAKATGRRVNFNYVDTAKLERLGIDRYDTKKPKGNNFIRVVTPSKVGPFAKEIWKHSNVGADGNTFLCLQAMLKKRCPVCDYIKRLKSENADPKVIGDLAVGKRYLLFVVDTTSEQTEEEGPKWFDCPPTIYQQICSLSVDKRTGKKIDPTDPKEGRDIEFTRVDAKRTSYGNFVLKEAGEVPESWYKNLPSFDDILLIPDIVEVERAVSGMTPSDENEAEETSSATRRERTRGESAKEPEKDADTAEEPEEAEPKENEAVVEEIVVESRKSRVRPRSEASGDSEQATSVRQKLAEIESRRKGAKE
jgi:hypothetical protein